MGILLLVLSGYFIASVLLNRVFLFNDDILRLQIAAVSPESLFQLHPWGGKVWLPLPAFLQGVAMKVMPLNPILDALLLNLALVSLGAVLVHRLSRRVCPGALSLLAPLLFVMSPSMAWLATSALSEPLFVVLLLGQALFLVRSLEHAEKATVQFAWAAGFAFLAMLTRYEAWFTCPPSLIAVAFWNRRRRGHKGWGDILLAVAALIAPISWMLASQFRYGDPLANLNWLADIHRGHNSGETVASAFGQTLAAAPAVSVVG